MPWPKVESSKGHFDWSSFDNTIGNLASRGVRVLPVLFASPGWVTKPSTKPPLGSKGDRQAWKGFVRHAVDRYGAGGTYWRSPLGYLKDHPGKRAVPVTAWQVWNEPNLPRYFHPKPSPHKYATLLRISHNAIKSADPKAKVVFAGMPGNAIYGVDAWKFLRRVYNKRGAKHDFDVVALHPYATTLHYMRKWIKRTHKVMRQNGDGHKPLWITELAWGSDPPDRYGFNKGPQGQKRMLNDAMRQLYRLRHKWSIRRVYWFELRDPGGENRTCSFCGSAGLLKHSGNPKPAWKAFKRYTGG